MVRNALSVASECVPLVKTGGLADVVGALPAAMADHGWHLRTLLPGYPAVLNKIGKGREVWQAKSHFGGTSRLLSAEVDSLDLLVLDAPHLFAREGSIYLGPDGVDWPDNPERFAALSDVAANVADDALGDWRPEIVHAHDWQAGFVPTYLRHRGIAVPSIMTIHNIAFQGHAPPDRLERLRLPAHQFHTGGYEYYGGISALKAGLVDADAITTVSPTYARELTTPQFGMGLDGVIRSRVRDLHGILNGIDEDVWSPAADPHIVNYTRASGKKKNRQALLEEFGITDTGGPLCIVVSRLTAQKGIDLLLAGLPRLLAAKGMLALLGTGESNLEARLRAAGQSPAVGVRIGYDEGLSHRMFAAGDAVLVPSRFEPCGLTQLYGLRYGTVPVVARTGGLADTVINANDAALRAGVATGITHDMDSTAALGAALDQLCALYADKTAWGRLQRNGMKHPVGWSTSAGDYAALYDSLAGETV